MPTLQGCTVSDLASLKLEPSLSNMCLDFEPKELFTCLYHSAIQQLGETLRVPNLCRDVEKLFVEMTLRHFRSKASFAQTHLRILQSMSAHFSPLPSFTTCLCCFVRAPEYTFSCRHRFCSCCVKIYGQHTDPLHYTLNYCLLCQSRNSNKFRVKPATAGKRVLVLGGSTPENTAQFLEDLQHEIGLVTMPLTEHFDIILGFDIGMAFYVRTT